MATPSAPHQVPSMAASAVRPTPLIVPTAIAWVRTNKHAQHQSGINVVVRFMLAMAW